MPKERFKFSEDMRNDLVNVGPELDDLEEEIRIAKDIGIDTDDLEKDVKKLKKLRTGMLKNYS